MGRHLKFLEIATAIKKEARVVRHVVDGTFPHYRGRGVIQAPEGRSVAELYVLAHECGHAFYRHLKKTPKWLAEYQAETWAHEAFQRHGLLVSKVRTKCAKKNVRMELDVAWDCVGPIAEEAAEWCDMTLPKN